MIDLNNNIINTQQYDLTVNSSQTVSVKQEENVVVNNQTNDYASKAEISNLVLNQINQTISVEDVLTKNLGTAKLIYNSLGSLRNELCGLISILKSSDIEHTLESLEELDFKANSLIDNAIKVVKENDKIGIVNIDFINKCFKGLNSLKELQLDDENYLDKISGIEENFVDAQNTYNKEAEALEKKVEENSKNYEKNISNEANPQESSSKEIQVEIVNNVSDTLVSCAANLTPENVMRLLQNK